MDSMLFQLYHIYGKGGENLQIYMYTFFVSLLTTKLRRGAINAVQLNYLESYKPSRKSDKKCVIM